MTQSPNPFAYQPSQLAHASQTCYSMKAQEPYMAKFLSLRNTCAQSSPDTHQVQDDHLA
jgi:hypothetical protein